uniref:RNA helicase n=1 Tax=Aegilops tauschii subsp. strangulata TaxID=200361 RepID=A0A453JVZ4_AEGTS
AAILLLRAGPDFSSPPATEVDALVAGLRPDSLSVFSSGRHAARLLFRSLPAAAAAARDLWSLRLEGRHLLTPYLPDAALAAKAFPLISSLFASHASRLLDSDLVSRLAARSSQLAASVQSVKHRLRVRRSNLRDFDQLNLQRKTLEADKDLLDAKIAEYKAAMMSIRRAMLSGTDEEEEGVDLFGIVEGDDVDFARVHTMMLRECRRLNEGLPIYAYRRKILNHIFANQVMILIGETGSGKSTQLVQYLADSGLAANGSIVCTQPRKIAAITLARRVDEESNGCYADNFVSSCSTFSGSRGFSSEIIFGTDSYLLHHCMNDTGLDGVSYIIVDEAHERSLNTDLLLALIKKELLDRVDLRLIIMSATADANRLAEYFYGCQTFHVKGRNFPVEIKYIPDVSVDASFNTVPNSLNDACATASYVNDVVRVVSVIHKNEEEGAILAFLTSQLEVEWACENFSDASAVVLPMHGKLSHVEQSRVFNSYPGKRKVIFCTNMAETSLTIKEVKYVVDPGLAKESRFVPSSGLNVLKVNWISQSSANQRAGRAGRTGAGKCYRLYSESHFRMMEVHQEPEIRKVHLGTAVLRILALGVRDAQNFEFVDAPNPEAINMALKNLEQLGAVKCKCNLFELTDTGRYLVKLGIEPRLGKIMLDCFDSGLRKEGVILAAVMANSSSIFCRVGTNEEKHKADLQKVRLCHQDGDLFTLLAVYKKWEDGNGNRNMWCWQNSINAKTMRKCQETISELENCLKHELNIIVPSYWCWNPEVPSMHDKLLKRIILSSLTGNLAMFLGHEKFGYQVISTDQAVNLHPSCSLLNYGSKPEWVVFTEILSIPNQYLIKVISGLGHNLLRRFCGKYGQNQHRIISHLKEECRDDRITVEINFKNNEVVLFATRQDIEKVFCIVNGALECEAKMLRNECLERRLFPGRPGSSPLALFGSGAEIKHLELGKRYLTVEVLHQNAHDINDKELIFLVGSLIPGVANFHKSAGNFRMASDETKWGKLTFLKPEDAEEAVLKLNGIEFHGSSLKVVPVCSSDNRGLPFPAVRARLSWPCNPSRGRAFGTRLLRPREAPIIGPSVSACEEALIREISSFMPNKSFPGQNFRVEVFPPEENNSMMRATITFDGSLHREAARALDHLEGSFLPCCQPWQMIRCKHVFHSTLSCPLHVYNVISQEVNSLLESFRSQKGVSYNFEKTDNGIFRLKLTANATKTIADLRRPLEILMKGNTINHPDLTISAVQLLMSHDGVVHLKSIEQETGTYILYDRQSLNIKVFGHQDQMATAETKLVHALTELLEKKPLEISLRGHNLPPDLMKKTVENFGVDLEGLKKEMPAVNVELHKQRHLLKVWGSKEDKRRVEGMISELITSVKQNALVQLPSGSVGGSKDKQRVDDNELAQDACPICLCETEDPFELESCGHMFCWACLVDQCESAMKSHDGFPVCCLKTGCKKPFLIVDLKHLVSNEKLEDLFRASLRTFVESRAGMYRFCPTPDCQSIYQVAAPDAETKPFVCGACYVEICTKCHLEYHPFMSCEAYKQYKEDPDATLLEWRRGKENVKNCPSCGYTIEKSEGCNHVECRCGS